MKHLLILLSILLLSSPLFGQSEETCYVVVDSSEEFNTTLLSNMSVSLISQFLKEVEPIPPEGVSMDSCLYQISVSKEQDTTFVTFKGKNLNSYGDSKLSGTDGFQQSLLKSLYRSLRDKRKSICEDYGTLLEECGGVVVQDIPKKVTIPKVEPKVVEIPKKVQEPVVQKIEKVSTNGMFVIVGRNGTILNSENGIEWTRIDSNLNENFTDIIYGNKKFVGIGNRGVVMTSVDSYNWDRIDLGPEYWLMGITFKNDLYYTVGFNGFIAKSKDGFDWEYINSGITNELWDITYGNGMFVIVGRDGTIINSTDGEKWDQVDSNVKIVLRGIDYGNKKFVIVGDEGTILSSSDGIKWTKNYSENRGKFTDIIFAENQFITVGNAIYTSTNGKSWKRRRNASGFLTGITYGNGLFIVTDLDGSVFTSKDGVLWKHGLTGSKSHLVKVTNSFIKKKVEPKVVEIPKKVEEPVVQKTDQIVLYGKLVKDKRNQYVTKWFSYGNDKTDQKYVGETKNGLPNGKGTQTFPNGDKYIGEFWNGKRHGQGTIYWTNGNKVVGEFQNNEYLDVIIYDSNGNEISRVVK